MKLTRKMMMTGVAAGVVVTMVSLLSPSVRACIHMPELYENSFEAQSQQSIVYHDGKLETLVVKIDAPTGGKGAAGKPVTLIEIIPVPAAQAKVQLDTLRLAAARASEDDQTALGEQAFKDLKEVVDEYCKPATRGGIDGMVDYGIPVGREIIVGPYGITKFDNSAAGIKGLKAWAAARSIETANGAVDSAPVKPLDTDLPAFQYYTKGTWTFCAVRVVDMAKALTPVEVTFPSKQIYWPIKLTAAGTKASQSRDGSYTAYAITKAGKDMTPLVEDMARHGMNKAEGWLNMENKQAPLKLGKEALSSRVGLTKLLNHFGLKEEDGQVMRFSGHFMGREAVRFADDVFSTLK